MKNREPYQIIIMRPTGEKPVMTVRSFWAKLILIAITALLVYVVVISVKLIGARNNQDDQKQIIAMQSEELKDLNILLTQEDEEIISLKKKLSMSITHKAAPLPKLDKTMPKLYPPIAEITEVSQAGNRLLFKIVNIKSGTQEMVKGYVYAVFKKGRDYACYPSVKLDGGIPVEKKRGHAFTIRNFKPMNIGIPRSIGNWETVTFYIFDYEEKLRLALSVNKVQIQ